MNFHVSPRLGRVTLALGAAGLLAIGSFGSVYAADPSTNTNSTTAAAVHHFCIPEWAAVIAHPGNVDILRAAGDCEINRRFVTLDGLTATDESETVAAAGVMVRVAVLLTLL